MKNAWKAPRDVSVRLTLLGGCQTRLATGQAVAFTTRKTQALLAYLATRPGHAHPRDKLAALLWGDRGEDQARDSLRHTLVALRKVLPTGLIAEGRTLALDPAAVAVDVVDFVEGAATGTPEALEAASALYGGDFLDGFDLREPAFEEWLMGERVRLREIAIDVLTRLLVQQRDAGRVEGAIQTGVRLLGLDPTQEAAHRLLMGLYVRQGRRGAALRQYQTCMAVVRRELGTAPEPQTRALYLELLQQQPERTEADAPASPADRETLSVAVPDLSAADTPLIGRAVERQRLGQAWDDAERGRALLAIVEGEAGIGKSRLVAEVAHGVLARGGAVLLGRSYEGEQLPFGPWVDALRGAGLVARAQDHSTFSPAVRGELARLFPELGAPSAAPSRADEYVRLFEAVAAMLVTIAERTPLLVVLEDLHWADELSVRLLAFLRRRLADRPVLLLGTVRETDLESGHPLVRMIGQESDERLIKLSLGGLSEPETTALVQSAARAGTAVAAVGRLGERLWRASDGNPLQILETLHTLEDQDLADTGPLPLPKRVREVISARLDRLSAGARGTLSVAAAIGRSFDFALLEAAAGTGAQPTAEAVEELVGRRILHAVGEQLDFTHDRIREVAYARVIAPTRRALHRAIAGAVERLDQRRLDEVADQLGHHYREAGEVSRALPYLVRFAELATQRYALEDGCRAFEQARACVAELPPAERATRQLDLALQHTFVLSILGRQREILELLGAIAADAARVTDLRLTAEYHFRVGLTQFYLGDLVAAQQAAERALHDGERADDAERIGKALHVLSLVAYGTGRPREGMVHATRAIDLLDLPQAQHWLGLVHHDLAVNAVTAGDLDTALQAAERADAVGHASGWPRVQALACYSLAWARVLRGEVEKAIEAAGRGLALSGDVMTSSLLTGSMAMAQLERGDGAGAVSLLAEVVKRLAQSPVRSGEVRNLALLSEAHLLAGDRLHARELAERAVAMGEADGAPFNIGLARRALGRIALADGDLAGAQQHLTAALSTFAAMGATFEMGRTHVELGRASAAQGASPEAREHFRAACRIFDAAHAPRRTARVVEGAAALGIELTASDS
jgi:DNA-binding SARP family transcriptional activator